MDMFIIMLIVIIFGLIYFLPTLVACLSNHKNAGAIFALNLLFGWTIIFWGLGIVWALTKSE